MEAVETLDYGVFGPCGVGNFFVLEIVRSSGGGAIAVAVLDMNGALTSVWNDLGWWICPEGAACLAAIPRLIEDGLILPGNEVVAFNTGSLEKYLPDLRYLL